MTKYLRDGRSPVPKSEVVSRAMSANKGRDTGPELALRSALRGLGVHGYRVNMKGVPGRPDIAFGRQHLAIFVHGCFWHRCPRCNLPVPTSNTEYWGQKFKRNTIRDRRKIADLKAAGWRTLVFWECEINGNANQCARKILRSLKVQQ